MTEIKKWFLRASAVSNGVAFGVVGNDLPNILRSEGSVASAAAVVWLALNFFALIEINPGDFLKIKSRKKVRSDFW